MTTYKKKIYFIIGPTSSGKTAKSIELAKKIAKENIGAEIISADSRQIYRDFNLSSGKVTEEEMEDIPHHLLDVVNPGIYFSVVDFENLAVQKIEEIYSRGNVPIICGGTGFYIDVLLYKYNLPVTEKDELLRKKLDNKNGDELFEILQKLDSEFANKHDNLEYKNNRHRMIRAIEIATQLGKIPELIKELRFNSEEYTVEVIKMQIPREILREKIYKRLIERVDLGMVEEIRNAKEKYNLSYEYLEGLGLEFKWIAKFLKNEVNREEMLEKLYIEICQYAKRQDTWFRRY